VRPPHRAVVRHHEGMAERELDAHDAAVIPTVVVTMMPTVAAQIRLSDVLSDGMWMEASSAF